MSVRKTAIPVQLHGQFHKTAYLGSYTAHFQLCEKLVRIYHFLTELKTHRTTAKVCSFVELSVNRPRYAVITAVKLCGWNCTGMTGTRSLTELPYMAPFIKCLPHSVSLTLGMSLNKWDWCIDTKEKLSCEQWEEGSESADCYVIYIHEIERASFP